MEILHWITTHLKDSTYHSDERERIVCWESRSKVWIYPEAWAVENDWIVWSEAKKAQEWKLQNKFTWGIGIQMNLWN